MNEMIFYFFYNLLPHQSVFWNGVTYFFAEIFPYIMVASIGCFYYIISDPDNNFRDFIEKNSRSLTNVFFSGIIAWGFAVVLKILIHTDRPFILLSNVAPLFPESGYAFPSGHTMVASAIAFALFFTHKKAGYVFMFFALIIGIARIIAGVHFPVDILGGFILGALVALFVRKFILRLNLF